MFKETTSPCVYFQTWIHSGSHNIYNKSGALLKSDVVFKTEQTLSPRQHNKGGKSKQGVVSYPGEESVEAVDLLPLCDVGVVLSYALQC